jgi:hypothetical protein
MEQTLKIRCSSLGAIMTEPQKKSETLSETCKTELRKLWIWKQFRKTKDITSKYIEKGLENEEEALTMITEHDGCFYIKNEKTLENDYIKGTPDIIHDSWIIDTKVSWDIFTFAGAKMTKDYEYQLRGYMALTGVNTARLVYVLSDTPEKMIMDEIRRQSWKMGMIEVPQTFEDLIRVNMTYDNVPKESRVKVFQIERDLEIEQQIFDRVELCREYFKTIKL